MLHRRQLVLSTAAALAAIGLPAHAEDAWPSRPIRFVVPFAPGGTGDIIGRIIAEFLSPVLKQPIIIENRGGAGGTVGTEDVAKSAPDGYSFLMASTGTLTFNPWLYPRARFDTLKDFAPVIETSSVPNILAISPKLPIKNVAEFVAYAKANPGKLNYASAGVGSSAHVSMAYFNTVTGIDMVHIPFKGTNPAVTEVVSGRVEAILTGAPPLLPFIQSGHLRALAATSLDRLPFAPDLPTVAESGYPGFEAVQWQGLVAPAKTPPAIIQRVHAEVSKLLDNPQLVSQLATLGAVTTHNATQEFGEHIRKDKELWGNIIKKLDINGPN